MDLYRSLVYMEDFVTNEASAAIIDELGAWEQVKSSTGRQVQQFGFTYNYSNRSIAFTATNPLPPLIAHYGTIIYNLLQSQNIKCNPFNQVIVNKYDPGQGISAHVDASMWGPCIACITLCAPITIIFEQPSQLEIPVVVSVNSLYVMTGDSRYSFKHKIVGKKSDIIENIKTKRTTRISITYRHFSAP